MSNTSRSTGWLEIFAAPWPWLVRNLNYTQNPPGRGFEKSLITTVET